MRILRMDSWEEASEYYRLHLMRQGQMEVPGKPCRMSDLLQKEESSHILKVSWSVDMPHSARLLREGMEADFKAGN